MITEDEARSIARLYEVAFDRDGALDRAGLNYWIDRYDALTETGLSDGAALQRIAEAFIASDEFASVFGDISALSDREVVEAFYLNALERDGDTAGVDYWTARLGEADFGVADLLAAFASSPENVLGKPEIETIAEVQPGEWWFDDGAGGEDLPAGPSTPASIPPEGGLVVSEIETEGDIDWIELVLDAGVEYRIRATGSSNEPLNDPAIGLYGPDMPPDDLPFAFSDDLERFDPAIFYRPQESGSVYVSVGAADGGTGRYKVEAVANAELPDDPRDGPTTQYHVLFDDGVWTLAEPGTLGGGDDSDWYSVIMQGGEGYRISLDPAAEEPVEDADIILRGPGGIELARADTGGADRLDFTPSSDGIYYVDIALAEGEGAYELEVLAF